MDTPNIGHLTALDYEQVYEPAEDSFFMLDALEADLDFIENKLKPTVCLEIGPGSGIIITALSKRLTSSVFCLASDINPYACIVTKRTALRNFTQIECIQGSLADALNCKLVDLLIFNPPYVPTAKEEFNQEHFCCRTECNLINSWDGGPNGRRVIDVFIKKLPEILSPRGVLYLLLLRENRLEEIMQNLRRMGYKSEQFLERRIPGEYLYILKIRR